MEERLIIVYAIACLYQQIQQSIDGVYRLNDMLFKHTGTCTGKADMDRSLDSWSR